jgi:hypothetical protein
MRPEAARRTEGSSESTFAECSRRCFGLTQHCAGSFASSFFTYGRRGVFGIDGEASSIKGRRLQDAHRNIAQKGIRVLTILNATMASSCTFVALS